MLLSSLSTEGSPSSPLWSQAALSIHRGFILLASLFTDSPACPVLCCGGVVLVVSCVVLFLLCVCVCALFLFLQPPLFIHRGLILLASLFTGHLYTLQLEVLLEDGSVADVYRLKYVRNLYSNQGYHHKPCR